MSLIGLFKLQRELALDFILDGLLDEAKEPAPRNLTRPPPLLVDHFHSAPRMAVAYFR